jgi:NAD-dependent dihydropyrimidine dehydrogenase PreA subunit
LPSSAAYQEAAAIHGRFDVGSWVFGGWLGLVLGMRMVGQSIRRHRREYEIDAGSCVACGRCYASCPVEHAGAPALTALSRNEQS